MTAKKILCQQYSVSQKYTNLYNHMVYFTYLFTNTQFFIRPIIQCVAGASLLNTEGSDAMMADDYSKKQLNDTPPM